MARITRDHFSNKVIKIDDHDRQVWEMLKNVPRIPKVLSFFCAIINLIVPGSGTILAACLGTDTVSKI